MNPIMQTMLNHRSIRKYADRDVDQQLLKSIVQCGQAAASSSFIQAFSAVQVGDKEHRRQIAEAAGGQPWVEAAPVFLVLCADLYRVNHCCEQQGLGELEGQAEHFFTAAVDVGLAAQNMMLAAESLGLGAVFIGGIRNDPMRVAKLLELPRHVFPAFGMCIGWPDQESQVKPRLPVRVVLHDGTYRLDTVADDVAAYDQTMADYYHHRNENQRISDWSAQTAKAMQAKKREHMLQCLQAQGFNLR